MRVVTQQSRALKAVAPVQIRSGLLKQLQVMGLVRAKCSRALIICPSFREFWRQHATGSVPTRFKSALRQRKLGADDEQVKDRSASVLITQRSQVQILLRY